MSNKNAVSRRNFFKLAGLASVAGAGLAACRPREVAVLPTITPQKSERTPTPTSASATHSASSSHQNHGSGGTSNNKPAAQHIDMDAAHEQGIQTFLDYIGQDDGFWPPALAYTLDGDTKVFDLICKKTDWAVEPERIVSAYTYNGIVPGPEIRVTEGDMVRINVHNEMDESTVVHWHGVIVPNNMDGVPFITQPLIKSGETFTYEFEAINPGTHMYHSHHNSLVQVTRGMMGPFIIDPKDRSQDPDYDSDYTIVLNDTGIGFTLNGKSFPYTQPIIAKLGERVRIRYMNEGLMIHPMHLHGIEQLVFAKDGWNLPQPYYCDTVNVAPGERWDVIVDCHSPGIWAYHCHILSHAEGPHGMFGMVTCMVVEEV
ncbi:MAG: copper oxidase [Chloroflexota bacterium]